ncbi:hypothetical protein [Nocardia iowensis]|uniref:Uncharacterized protein n=1 Tax=Nocardia iowensis TaxID=204891 RepID=A0ABX8RSV3_NOCIO|nr:hypothetical protein [Nocardia iowensis]QXN91954.1 hypothetical protein KV110_01815 [Nocardia iowensis]
MDTINFDATITFPAPSADADAVQAAVNLLTEYYWMVETEPGDDLVSAIAENLAREFECFDDPEIKRNDDGSVTIHLTGQRDASEAGDAFDYLEQAGATGTITYASDDGTVGTWTFPEAS